MAQACPRQEPAAADPTTCFPAPTTSPIRQAVRAGPTPEQHRPARWTLPRAWHWTWHRRIRSMVRPPLHLARAAAAARYVEAGDPAREPTVPRRDGRWLRSQALVASREGAGRPLARCPHSAVHQSAAEGRSLAFYLFGAVAGGSPAASPVQPREQQVPSGTHQIPLQRSTLPLRLGPVAMARRRSPRSQSATPGPDGLHMLAEPQIQRFMLPGETDGQGGSELYPRLRMITLGVGQGQAGPPQRLLP